MTAKTDSTDATLTEHLTAAETDDSIEGPAVVKYMKLDHYWRAYDAQPLDDDPDEYRAECSCGEAFTNWGAAARHVEEQH